VGLFIEFDFYYTGSGCSFPAAVSGIPKVLSKVTVLDYISNHRGESLKYDE